MVPVCGQRILDRRCRIAAKAQNVIVQQRLFSAEGRRNEGQLRVTADRGGAVGRFKGKGWRFSRPVDVP
jgi:hypothetical protein